MAVRLHRSHGFGERHRGENVPEHRIGVELKEAASQEADEPGHVDRVQRENGDAEGESVCRQTHEQVVVPGGILEVSLFEFERLSTLACHQSYKVFFLP